MSAEGARIVVVDRALAREFPGLALRWIEVEARSGRSPREVRERLRRMSDRISGARAVQLRREAVPWAYRVFFRQVGIDPDERRTPIEALVLERLRAGGFKSRSLLDDAIAIATFETGVALVAFDADRVGAELHLRLAQPGELLGAMGRPLSSGQIVIGDAERALAVLFADVDPDRGVSARTRRMLVAAIQVPNVPDIAVEEALWTVWETLTAGIT